MNQPAAPAWTLKGKKYSIDQLNNGHKDDSPGPIYNMWDKGTKTLQSGFKTGNSQRLQINHGVLNNPSPSQYSPNNPNLLSHSVTIPKDAKMVERYKQENPDPAAYKSNSNFVKNSYPNFSMASKYPSIMDDTGCNPGPGDYNNPEVLMASTMYRNSKFGTQPRFSHPNLNIPGPGDYQVGKGFITGKNSLSKSRRSLQIKQSPGPGQYKHSDQFENNVNKNVGKTLSKRLEGCFNTESNTVQAFNNYFKDGEKTSGRAYSIGNEKRIVFKRSQLPGPTDYKTDFSKTIRDQTKVGFAKSSWVQKNQQIHNPGPGHYKDYQAKSTRYTIPKSKSISYLNPNPGAGRYEPSTGIGQKREKFSRQLSGNLIGKSHRTNFISKNSSGVGDYNILMAKTGGVSIPKANRFPKPNNNPGPGDYNMTSTLSNFNMYRKRF